MAFVPVAVIPRCIILTGFRLAHSLPRFLPDQQASPPKRSQKIPRRLSPESSFVSAHPPPSVRIGHSFDHQYIHKSTDWSRFDQSFRLQKCRHGYQVVLANVSSSTDKSQDERNYDDEEFMNLEEEEESGKPVFRGRRFIFENDPKRHFLEAVEEVEAGGISRIQEELEILLLQSEKPDLNKLSLDVAVGKWRVIYAPHIRNILTPLLFTQFPAIEYTMLPGGGGREQYILESNVEFSNLLFRGTFNASGFMRRLTDRMEESDESMAEVQVLFDHFWVGAPGAKGSTGGDGHVVDTVGRLFFVPTFSIFPVLYLDQDLAVFKFKPLDSVIVIRKVDTPQLTAFTTDEDWLP